MKISAEYETCNLHSRKYKDAHLLEQNVCIYSRDGPWVFAFHSDISYLPLLVTLNDWVLYIKTLIDNALEDTKFKWLLKLERYHCYVL